jgi:hypothetical protein
MSFPCKAVVAVVLGVVLTGAGSAQDPKRVARDVLVGVARVDPFARSLTVRTDQGLLYTVYVGPELTAFDELKAGDTVRVRVVDSYVVAVRRDARPTVFQDTTAAARREGGDGPVEVVQQLKAIVTIESVDIEKRTVVYKAADNRSVMRFDVDPHLLEGLKKGDVVELTYTRERAIELEKVR